jgi:hypothetical protein
VTVAAIFIRAGLLNALRETGLGAGVRTEAGFGDMVPLGHPLLGSLSIRDSFRLISFALAVSAKEILGKAALLLLVEARV